MPYRFDEFDQEPRVQTSGNGRREPPRTGILLDMMDAPAHDYRWLRTAAAIVLISILGWLLFLTIRSLFH